MEQGKINNTFTHPNEAATKGAAVGASKRGVKMRGGVPKLLRVRMATRLLIRMHILCQHRHVTCVPKVWVCNPPLRGLLSPPFGSRELAMRIINRLPC